MKKQRKLEVVSSEYVFGLRAPSFKSVERMNCIAIEDAG